MQLPGPVRAAIGLAANVVDEARHLPDRAIELPMLAVSTALQMSLRAQQRYAGLAARGDEVLGGTRTTDDPPAWATFDDPVPPEDLRSLAREQLGESPDATALIEELFGPEGTPTDNGPGAPDADLTPPTPITDAKSAPSGSARAHAAMAGATATRPATSTRVRKKAPTAKASAPAKAAVKATTRTAGAKRPAAKKSTSSADGSTSATSATSGKRVSKPRHTTPSKFDDAGDND